MNATRCSVMLNAYIGHCCLCLVTISAIPSVAPREGVLGVEIPSFETELLFFEVFKLCKCSTCKPNRLVGVVVRDIVISAGRGVEGDAPPPLAIFKHIFDQYNFSIISSSFNNNKP